MYVVTIQMEHSLNQTTSKDLFKLTVSGRYRLRGLTAQFSTQEHIIENKLPPTQV